MNFIDNPAINSEKSRIMSFIFSKSHETSIQLFKYGFVGGIAFCVDFGSLFFLTEVIKIHYLISAAIAFILGLLTNYTLSILWVFPKRAIADKRIEFLLFLIIGLVGLGLNEVIIWFFTEFIHFYYLISKLFSTVVVFFWNFFARKKLLFS
ncbi:MAG: GtrA family protein [Candidatus Aminicenantaceae bacterium]